MSVGHDTPAPSPRSREPAPPRRRPAVRATSARVDHPEPFSARLRHGRKRWGMSLNLTPMIDVVFLLLFFFLVATRFGSLEGTLPARLPGRTAAATEIPRTPIRVRFVATQDAPPAYRVTIDRFCDTPLEIASLADMLADIRRNQTGFEDADTPVHLLAGDEVPWDHVVNAYNACLVARYEKIYFLDSP